jgi:hypothetical protein
MNGRRLTNGLQTEGRVSMNKSPQTHEAGLQRPYHAKNVSGHGEGVLPLSTPRYARNTAEQTARIDTITERLLQNAAAVRYGSVSVSLRLHEGRIVDVTHAVTEQTKEGANGKSL